jgi:4-hydroxybenzoate polyprenyltransferase/phosphoserine phosphatase
LTTTPLCVDLDGTLIKSDLLLESAALLLRDKPWLVLALPFWLIFYGLFKGRAAFKRHLAGQVRLDASSLPFNNILIDWLREQKTEGRVIILATAADSELAASVAGHLGIFDEVVASDGKSNVKGTAKLERLRELFGNGFDYAGDSSADLPIWAACRQAILVNPSDSTLKAANARATVARVFRDRRSTLRLIIKEMRVYQWVKNLLIFVPLITSHQLTNFDLLFKAVVSFFSFSLVASSVYLINDLSDLQSDRLHTRKRLRPLASGNLSLGYAFVLAPLLLLAGFGLTAFLPLHAFELLLTYFALTLLYSFWLKRKLLVDVFTLSTLYTLRILAGQAAYCVELSTWLLSFSMFLFLSLGFAKRGSELYNLLQSGRQENTRRGYRLTDLPQVNVFGVAAGFAASLVLTLYMNSENVQKLYKQPELLWLLFPLMLYWISRIWIITFRGAMNEDPILFAARDRVTQVIAVLVVLLMLVASQNVIRF